MSNNFILTNPLGQQFNISSAWEYWLDLETEDQLPKGFERNGYNSATLYVKTVTGSVQLFPLQTISSLIDSIMPGLNVDFFEGFGVEASGQFWYDPEKKPRDTIQPTYKLLAAIEGSRYRKLLKTNPEASRWSMNEKVLAIQDQNIQPDFMYVEGVPYTAIWLTGQKLGRRFFKDAEHVIQLHEEAMPGCIESHPQQVYIEQNIRAPFDELKKLERQRKAKEDQARAGQSGIQIVK